MMTWTWCLFTGDASKRAKWKQMGHLAQVICPDVDDYMWKQESIELYIMLIMAYKESSYTKSERPQQAGSLSHERVPHWSLL